VTRVRWILAIILGALGTVVLFFAALIWAASVKPIRPGGVPEGSWNAGTMFQPGWWISCRAGEGQRQSCRIYDASGTASLYAGQYLKVDYEALDRHDSDAAFRQLRDQFVSYRDVYLVGVTFVRYPMSNEDQLELYARDEACVLSSLRGDVKSDPSLPQEDSRAVLETALTTLHAAFPKIDLGDLPVGAPTPAPLTSQAFVARHASRFDRGTATACGLVFSSDWVR
jgi:hypothetical protein